ncbi:protein-export membrane protein SecD [Clostridium baratii]|uniref:protein translocase subunit SecD n=1 Tax=Clostridium baratii TaxID=1561 RepID=UPI0009A407A5|nr:protein translocase subunit SecD [Clostridium baratii]OPF51916.1 preprotein translocase subunit SecD [Clostridium baratii]OPF53561.1 protein-export membrane protein SecD [Clostridium baratii]OPF56506.1 protein-export membrane protein SecD [Clostridium baratii]OPF60608.1 protein-export membrane protein SecD [Clostridium baratii]
MKAKGKSTFIFTLCTLAIIILTFVCFKGVTIGGWEVKSFDQTITKGLDLQGGVSVLLGIQDENVSKEDLQKTKNLIQLRVNKLGVAETVVTTEGDNRIRVDIPGEYNSQGIVDSLSKTGNLTFKSPDGKVLLTGKDVKEATAILSQQSSKPEVSLELNDEGSKKFAEATGKYLNQRISINMDDEQLTNPLVQSQITNGKAVITGMSSMDEAKNIAGLINSGALPVTIKALSQQTVGAQLGATALPNAVKAGVVGVGLIFLFMMIYYRVPGFIASIALTLYITLVLLIFVEIGATLTLPGIAGFLLTIGMAVDANVLIFERIREELRRGVSSKAAVKKGFENALSSIVDSNVTTIIAALVLYFMGSGAVKGFAITLLIGIVVSLFTALVVTKFLMNLALNMGILKKTSYFRVKVKRG